MNTPLGPDTTTERGFPLIPFKDEYGKDCHLQESSRAVCENEDGSVDDPLGWLWLGPDKAEPIILKSHAQRLGMELPPGEVTGWMPYPLPEEVFISTAMHLNEAQVRGLISRLQLWLDTGTILQ